MSVKRALNLLILSSLILVTRPTRADVTFTFSENAGTGGTRLSVSGSGVLDGLNTAGTPNFLTVIFDTIRVDDTGGSSNFDFVDLALTGSLTIYETSLTPTSNTFSTADFLSAGISFSSPSSTLINLDTQLLGFEAANFVPGSADAITLYTDGTALDTIALNTGYTLESAVPFSRFTEAGAASWTTGGSAGSNTLTVVVVPEPSSVLLLALGGMGVLIKRRR